MDVFHVIGLMSGSSLDGLDIALCKITQEEGRYGYEILEAETAPYPARWKVRIENLVLQNAVTYLKTHAYLGHFMGELVKEFIERHKLQGKVDFIASHGQTVFHQPENKFTSQIGDGAAIARQTGLTVICDFRSTDVAYGGQGAPVAPIADKVLFGGYEGWLNLGGFSNITIRSGTRYIAFDVTSVNGIMNHLAKKTGKEYDENGEIARQGTIHEKLLEDLNGTWYYNKDYPKSLSGGWLQKVIIPILSRYEIEVKDKLATVVEHIVYQHKLSLDQVSKKEGISFSKDTKILVTGGGAFNGYLIEELEKKLPVTIELPDHKTIAYKEALLMALMGVLRIKGEINTLASVTGAEMDTCGGAIYLGARKGNLSILPI